MYIDSGADIPVIPLKCGRSLGFRQEELKQISLKVYGIVGAGY